MFITINYIINTNINLLNSKQVWDTVMIWYNCCPEQSDSVGLKQTWARRCGSGFLWSRWSSSRLHSGWGPWSTSSCPLRSVTACSKTHSQLSNVLCIGGGSLWPAPLCFLPLAYPQLLNNSLASVWNAVETTAHWIRFCLCCGLFPLK